MKLSFQLIVLLLLFANPMVKANSFFANPDSCSPSFSDVYNFEINDVFQYRKTSTSSAGGSSPTYENIKQYAITNKTVDSNIVSYSVSGWTQDLFFYNNADNTSTISDTSIIQDYLQDYYVYIDSSNNFLNQCPKEIIKIKHELFEDMGIEEVFSKVQSKYIDSNLTKTIGGENNLFTYDDSGALIPLADIHFEAIYQEKLGMVSQEFTFFEMRESIILEAYIKGNDTVGDIMILEDIAWATNNSFNEANNHQNTLIYPNPGNGIINLSHENIRKIQVYNIHGQLVHSELINRQLINIRNLNPGVYFIRLNHENGSMSTEKYFLH